MTDDSPNMEGKYLVAEYKVNIEDGNPIGKNMSFKAAKQLADLCPTGFEREVYRFVDGKRLTIYRKDAPL